MDSDGLGAFSYQWIRVDCGTETNIEGATSSTYIAAKLDEGKKFKLEVSFTDDAGNEESLTSAATAEVEQPLTASVSNVPDSHDGSSDIKFELRFSEAPGDDFSCKTLRDYAFTVTGGEVTRARRLDQPHSIRWETTVSPNSNGTVTIVLPVTTDCASDGATCTSDGRMLSNRLELTISGP